jgi:hypothetical protein
VVQVCKTRRGSQCDRDQQTLATSCSLAVLVLCSAFSLFFVVLVSGTRVDELAEVTRLGKPVSRYVWHEEG